MPYHSSIHVHFDFTQTVPDVGCRRHGGGALFAFRSKAASSVVRHASIGASGQALSDLTAFASHPAFDLVAAADVDLCRFEQLQQRFPKVRVYQDWREML
jgi:hypothetical protein